MALKRQIRPASLVGEIQKRILANHYKPGDRLPRQEQLAATFDVSRNAMREALKQLHMVGLVEIRHGSGTFIRSVTPSSLFESLTPFLLMDTATALKLLEARLYIERGVGALAAKNASEQDIDDLKELVEGMRQDLKHGRTETFAEKDLEFHLKIAKASKNEVLASLLDSIRNMLEQFISNTAFLIPGMTESDVKQHSSILRAIEKHDVRATEKLMGDHILHVERLVRKHFYTSRTMRLIGKKW